MPVGVPGEIYIAAVVWFESYHQRSDLNNNILYLTHSIGA